MSKWWLAVAVLFVGYAILLYRNTSHAAGGPDESGYMNEARMFAAGKLRLEVEPLRTLHLDDSWLEVFTPLGFRPSTGRTIVPTYPPGLPLHLLLLEYFVSPLLALGCLVLTYAIAREVGLPQPYAVAAAAILAATPQFIMFALQVMSDVPATFWALMVIWCALRSNHTAGFAIAGGIAFAIGVAVRPTNVLMAIPLALAARRRIPFVLLGAAPLLLPLMWFQNALYGSPFKTGHGSLDELVSLSDFGDKLSFYTFWMGRTLTPLAAPLGLFVIFDRKVDKWHRALLTIWYLAFLFFYCFWQLLGEWWYTRYLLPATPAIIISAMLLVRDIAKRPAIAAVLIAIMIYFPVSFGSGKRILRIDDDQKVYTGSMKWSAELLPKEAMVISGVLSGAFLLYQNRFTARWDRLDGERFAVLRSRAKWYAVISDVEGARLPGSRWTAISKFRDVTLYRLDD
jgi:hypothetical protein